MKKIIGEIKKVDQKYQEMPKDELIKQAFDIAEQRVQAWYQKHGLKPGQLSEDELLDTINKIRDSD